VNSYIICIDVHYTVREKEDINNNTNKYADTSRVSVGGTAPQTRGGDHPASLRMVLGGLSSEVKRPRPEAGLTLQPSAEGKNKWNYTFRCLHGSYAGVEQKAVEK
jgi:hypothetical protein